MFAREIIAQAISTIMLGAFSLYAVLLVTIDWRDGVEVCRTRSAPYLPAQNRKKKF